MKTVDYNTFAQAEQILNLLDTNTKENNYKINTLIKEQKDLDFEIERLRDSMTRKADLSAQKLLEEKFNHYTPITKFLTLDNSMHNYVTRDSFDSLSLRFRALSDQVNLRDKIESVDEKVSKLKFEIQQIIKTLATKEDLDAEVRKQDYKLTK